MAVENLDLSEVVVVVEEDEDNDNHGVSVDDNTMNVREMMVNWLNLPDDLLPHVTDKLINIIDFISFGAACRSWQFSYTQSLPHHYCPPSPQLPLLMLATENDQDGQTRSLYSLSMGKISDFRVPLPHNKIVRGSTYGWMVIVDNNTLDVQLFNPFLHDNNKIELPSLFKFDSNLERDTLAGFKIDGYYLYRTVLSANPALNPNWIVMAIFGEYTRLAFYKPGDNIWTPVSLETGEFPSIENVVYVNNQIYAVEWNGTVYTCDVKQPHPKLSLLASPPPYSPTFYPMRIYLVELNGDLLQVQKTILNAEDCSSYFTRAFQVFKLDVIGSKWIHMKNLCGRVLFLGDNSPICLSPLEFPICKRNCIYFTDDYFEAFTKDSPDHFYDTGIFTFEDKSIERGYPMNNKLKYPPLIWIEPTPKRCFI